MMNAIGYILLAVLALVWWNSVLKLYQRIMDEPGRIFLAESLWWYRGFVFVTVTLLMLAFFTCIILILVGVCEFWIWLLGI